MNSFRPEIAQVANPKGLSTAHLRTLVPNTIPGIVFGTRILKWAIYGFFR